jgi:Protein of unknown function (DUF4012)
MEMADETIDQVRAPKGKRKGRRRTVVFVVALGIMGWIGWSAHLLFSAQSHISAARSQLRGVVDTNTLRKALDGDETLFTAPARDLAAAKDDLDSVFLSPLARVPIAGTQIRSARALTGTASRVVSSVISESNKFTPARRASLTQMQLLDELAGSVHRLRQATELADLGPSKGLLHSLAAGRIETKAQLAKVSEPLVRADDAMPGLRTLMTGPTKMLVVAANNAEMAAGSGRPLAAATMDALNGKISVGKFTWTAEISAGVAPIPLPAELTIFASLQPQLAMHRAAVTPRFDAVAPLLAAQYQAATGTTVDGVMLLDVVGLQRFVALGADVGNSSLSADKIVSELMNGQYQSFDETVDGENAARRERIGGVAGGLVANLLDRGFFDLGRSFADAAKGRHVLLWSARPEVQKAFAEAGASGQLTGDSLSMTLHNIGENKLDWFARVSATIDSQVVPSAGRHVSVRATITNDLPEGQPKYVAGPNRPNAKYGDYLGLLSLHVPGNAKNLQIQDSAVAFNGTDGPSFVAGTQISLARGQTLVVTFSFDVPNTTQHLDVEPSGSFPAISWKDGTNTWQSDAVRRLVLT